MVKSGTGREATRIVVQLYGLANESGRRYWKVREGRHHQ